MSDGSKTYGIKRTEDDIWVQGFTAFNWLDNDELAPPSVMIAIENRHGVVDLTVDEARQFVVHLQTAIEDALKEEKED